MAARSKKNKKTIPDDVQHLAKLFSDAGHEVRIVGGWVRDTLRGVTAEDLDLATTATPTQMVELCQAHNLRYFETGIQHGTITILPTVHAKPDPKALADDWKRGKAHPEIVPAYEITTLRVDAETDGRHARVEFTTDWRKDAERRDFTINAMSMTMDGAVHDYFDGVQHLAEKRVIFVGSARARIHEDYLRILRWFRFRSRLDDTAFDRDILNVIKSTSSGLTQISAERIWAEMSKILTSDSGIFGLLLYDMQMTEVLAHIGLGNAGDYDSVHATIVRKQSVNPITVLAALTPKPLRETWKLSNDDADLLEFLQTLRGKPRPDLAFFKNVVFEKGYAYGVEAASMFGSSDTLEAIRDWTPVNFPLTGKDLLERGFTPGPALGAKLKELIQVWKDSDYRMHRHEILALI